MRKQRIWELDALRGICILGMVAVHLIYDLSVMGIHIAPRLLSFFQHWGGIVFLVLSGICVTLGHRHIRRGLAVFGCGMVCTAATAGMYLLGLADKGILIRFGVLHCLGCCMVLWQFFSRCTGSGLALWGIILCAAGFFLEQRIFVDVPWLLPLGFQYPGSTSADYFPLLPNLGFFLFGALLGRKLYRQKETRFPRVNPQVFPVSFLCKCGIHSLSIYLLHQPVLTGILWLVSAFAGSDK